MIYCAEPLKNINIWINFTNILRDRRPLMICDDITLVTGSSKIGKTKLYCFGMYSEMVRHCRKGRKSFS